MRPKYQSKGSISGLLLDPPQETMQFRKIRNFLGGNYYVSHRVFKALCSPDSEPTPTSNPPTNHKPKKELLRNVQYLKPGQDRHKTANVPGTTPAAVLRKKRLQNVQVRKRPEPPLTLHPPTTHKTERKLLRNV